MGAGMVWRDYLPEDIKQLYEIHDYRHAAAILCNEFPTEFQEVIGALRALRITVQDIIDPGGNESRIPRIVSEIMRPLGWSEKRLTAKLVADDETIHSDTHKVDYLKGKVAFDLEWNSKDQTFDRDLFAFRTFFDYGRISLGVLLTRSNSLDPVFQALGENIDRYGTTRSVKAKYGASTTHMGKLLPRLEAGRNGGCPVLVFGITPAIITDWEGHPKNVGSH